MKYQQIDQILTLQPGKRLVGERTLRADEQYLKDHFPNFPVMPGVMMLEALHQASVWLIRCSENFQSPLIMLRETRSVKFGDFLSPGETLTLTADIKSSEGPVTKIKATATKNNRVTVSAILVLEAVGCGDPEHLGTDADISARARKKFIELFGDPADISASDIPATV